MNIHHLYLFHQVARCGGLSESLRQMPEKLTLGTLSAQIVKLEESIGEKLFHRRPFQLSPKGKEVYELGAPFFDNLREFEEQLRTPSAPIFRLAGSSAALREHSLRLILQYKQLRPQDFLSLHECTQVEAERLLRQGELDLAVTEFNDIPAPGIESQVLARLPIVLLLPESSTATSLRDILKVGRGKPALIALPQREQLYQNFRVGMERWGTLWQTSLEVSTLSMVEEFVRAGLGVGVSVALPWKKAPGGVRQIVLEDCPPLAVAACWRGALTAGPTLFLKLLRQRVAKWKSNSGRGGAGDRRQETGDRRHET